MGQRHKLYLRFLMLLTTRHVAHGVDVDKRRKWIWLRSAAGDKRNSTFLFPRTFTFLFPSHDCVLVVLSPDKSKEENFRIGPGKDEGSWEVRSGEAAPFYASEAHLTQFASV